MKKYRQKKYVLFTILLLVLHLSLSACSESNSSITSTQQKEVPDGVVDLAVQDYLATSMFIARGAYTSYSFDVTHNYDSSTHIDAAIIHLNVEYPYAVGILEIPIWYAYDKSSDLWTIVKKGEESFGGVLPNNDKLTGTWAFFVDEQMGVIEISKITPIDNNSNEVTLEYEFNLPAYAYNTFGNRYEILWFEGNGTYDFIGSSLRIPIDLPEGYFNESGEPYSVLVVSFDMIQGWKDHVYVEGGIYYKEEY